MRFLADIQMILTLSCRLASQLMSRAQDEQLTGMERAALRLHLLICNPCRRFNRQLRLLRQVLRTLAVRTRAGKALKHPLSQTQRRQLLHKIGLVIRKKP